MNKCVAFDGTVVPCKLEIMPCGGTPIFDANSGCSYVCDRCFTTIGSIAQPKYCVEKNKEESND